MAITLIAHTEVGSGGTSNVEFTSIPSSYDDLMLVTSIQGLDLASPAIGMLIQFNTDTATNYSETAVRTVATSPDSYRLTNYSYLFGSQVEGFVSGTNYPFASCYVYIPNYKNTSYHKQVIVDDAGGHMTSTANDNYLSMRAGLYRSTSAITSIKVGRLSFTYKLAQYSTLSLYGITKA